MPKVPGQGSSARPITPAGPITGKPGTSDGLGGQLIFGHQKGGSKGTGKGAH